MKASDYIKNNIQVDVLIVLAHATVYQRLRMDRCLLCIHPRNLWIPEIPETPALLGITDCGREFWEYIYLAFGFVIAYEMF